MNRLQSFLMGRNGPDALSKCTSILACLLLIISMFARGAVSNVLWILALLMLGVSYFRMFSRNIERRRMENSRFLELTAPLAKKHRQLRMRRQQRNIYSFFKCPECSTVLRVPKGKGRVRVTCKACGHKFERTT